MSTDLPLKPEFYAPWPLFGKAVNKQWTELRQNHESLYPLIKAAGVDPHATNFIEDALQSWEVGQSGFHNKYRLYWDTTDTSFKIQRNSGTEGCPTWETTLVSDSSGQLTDRLGQNIPGSGSGSGVTVRDTDGNDSFTGVTVLSFLRENFYVSQGTNSMEAIINSTGTSSGGGSGSITGGTSLGGDVAVFESTVDPNLRFRGLTAGNNITLTQNSSDIVIEALASLFYGVTVAQTNELASFSGINKINFNSDTGFYINQNSPNTDEVTVSVSGITGPTGPQGPAGADGADGADGAAIGTYTESPTGIEWVVNHNLNSTNLLWNATDDANEVIIPNKVDTSLPNTAYFYFNESIAGHVILSAGTPASGGGSITIKETSPATGDIHTHTDINTVRYNADYFYISQNVSSTAESMVNFAFTGDERIPGQLVVDDKLGIGTGNDIGVGGGIHINRAAGSPTFLMTREDEPNDNFSILQLTNGTVRFTITNGDSAQQGLFDIQTQVEGTSANAFVRMFSGAATNGNVALLLNDPNSSDVETKFTVENGDSWIHGSADPDGDNSGRKLGIGTITPTETLDVNGTMVQRGTSQFKKRASGFYLPWMEDVSEAHPDDNNVLTWDASTGTWGPEVSALDVGQSNGTDSRRTTKLSFNRDHFYVSPTSVVDETQVNRVPQVPFRSKTWSVNVPADGDEVGFGFVSPEMKDIDFHHVNAVVRGQSSPSAHWTIYNGPSADGTNRVPMIGEITNSTTTVERYNEFYISTVTENNFIWLEVAELVGSVNELMVELVYTSGGNGD